MAEKQGMSKDLDRKQLMLVGGLFVVLLVVVWFFFIKGGGDADLGAPPPVIPVQTTAPTETQGGDQEVEDPEEGPVETFEVFARRDPFEPVIELGGPPGVVDVGTTPPTDGASPAPGSTPFDPGTGDPGSEDPGTDDPADEQPPGTSRVKLIDAYKTQGLKRAQIRVDNTVYIVDEGETFAESFRLLSVSGKCASMLFGDDQFTLCEGDEVYK